MPYKLLNDKKTFADVNSENPTVCFLHGWGRSSKDFNLICKSFDSINFDLPGFGKSLEPESSMTPKEYVVYLNQLIPNSVDTIDQMAWFNVLVLVGWAFIGFFAFKFSVDKFLFKYR